jgi:hypothetical protein
VTKITGYIREVGDFSVVQGGATKRGVMLETAGEVGDDVVVLGLTKPQARQLGQLFGQRVTLTIEPDSTSPSPGDGHD